jgi:hypothetical protein
MNKIIGQLNLPIQIAKRRLRFGQIDALEVRSGSN